MLRIHCPICQEARDEPEFHYAGQAHIARPVEPDNCSDEQWGQYLYFRRNTRGLHYEMWYHAAGCRKFFNVVRDTVSYDIKASYLIGEAAPQSGEAAS
ncbi:MAG: sarcosine oxidase subunit delta [Proteobacteria bacterium]|jgi:heterotetrameric sarcosine oxidase delta subunit|nr:sarcosine oxidase subunit delta [Pseudomonadota bacterium]MDA0959046.1 sarcosine oxidase subunit delta [Pseudomonadota bacterium]